MDRRRVVLILTLVLIPLGGLEARLAHLQLFSPPPAAPRGALEIVRAPRGRLLDRNGDVLACDERSFDLHVILEEFEKRPEARAELNLAGLDESVERIYGRILALMNRRPERERARIYRRERKTPYLLYRGLTFEQASAIETRAERFPGCIVRETLRRAYPCGPIGCLVIGTLGRIDTAKEMKPMLSEAGFESFLDESALEALADRCGFDEEVVGRTGVERSSQERLRGKPGLVLRERDPVTRTEAPVDLVEARPGDDVTLTIDIAFQREVQSIVSEQSERTTTIVLDPSDGAVLAMATSATFDPNHFVPPARKSVLDGYQQDPATPLVNRATQSRFQLGSVFKIVTALAALETGKTTRDRLVECRGVFSDARNSPKCWTMAKGSPPHGPMTIVDALERSCNCYFYQMGSDLGMPALIDWAGRFGFGRKSGIELSEMNGNVPDRGTSASALRLAIGQDQLVVTPIQVARLLAVVANGGRLVRPHVVRGDAETEVVAISPRAIEVVREGLRAAVQGPHGTARSSGLGQFDAVGKTSTAQISAQSDKTHAWFAGYTPKAVIVVLVELGGHGGEVAAPVAAKILEKLK